MSGDLISRRAVLAALSSRLSIVDMVRVAEIVGSVPAVEAEPVVHAHWEKFKHPSGTHGIRCSHCKTVNGRRSKRCPECGAHMDEEVAE